MPIFVVYGSELIYIAGHTEDPGGTISNGSNGPDLIGAIANAVASLNSEFSLTDYEINYLQRGFGVKKGRYSAHVYSSATGLNMQHFICCN